MKIYKIRRKSDGLFSLGGASPKWGKIGKTWTSKRALKLHLSMLANYYNYNQRKRITDMNRVCGHYKECEIVEFVEVENNVIGIMEF